MQLIIVKDPITLEEVCVIEYSDECQRATSVAMPCGECAGCKMVQLSAEGYILEVRG